MDPDEIEMMGRTDMAADNKPDIMNDPAYDTNVKGKQNSMDEADTCRICRGEGSPGEALFYPCKCSGSIKFVHQNCLMEWLSHSQKKHCELCKTHFHFTKLYHPHMPTTVPLPIFIRQAAVHIWKSFLTWTRFQLVLFVWVAWLPWCMRAIWRGLFWIGDGAWVDWKGKSLQHNNSTVIDLSDKLATGDTTPINQTAFLSREALAAAFITKIATKLPDLVSPIQRVFSFANDEPLGIRLFKKAYHYSFDNDSGMIPSSMSAAENITRQSAQVARSASLLSEFKILKNLTRSNMLNKLVIDALEGQLITLLLVTTFILIFLIREWVVQQQPNFNGGAEPDADPPGLQNAEVPAPLPADQALQIPQAEEVVEGLDAGQQVQGPRARIIARARPRRPLHPRQIPARGGPQNDETAGEPSERSEDGAGNSVPTPLSQVKASTTSSSEQSHVLSRQRPAMPDRDTLAGAAEIRRTIEEQSRVSADRDELVAVFKDIWNRAGRKPSEVLRIIEDEERGEELSWIVATMKKIRDNPSVYPAADLPLDPEAQSGVPLLSNSDDEIFNSRQPSDDEGFVVLDKPSLSRGQEAKVNRDITEEDARLQSRAQLSQHPERSSSLLHSRNTANSNRIKLGDFSSDPETDFVAPVAEPDQAETSSETNADEHDSPPEASKGEINDFAITDRPRDASLENPFLPAYAGELPARNSNHGSPRLYNDVLGSSRTEQADSSPVASSEGDLASLVLDESSRHARPIAERITDWLWGGVAMPPTPQEQPVGGDDEHVVNDIANEAPFVPIDRGLPLIDAENDRGLQEQDPQVVAAAMQAGLDPNGVEAADDIEDLEGVMELVGMQGPLAGLIQNGMFCACLVSLTIFFGVWIPYMSGKLFLVILAHPVSILVKLPFRWAASTADMAIDIVLFATACTLYWTDTLIRVFCVPFGWIMPPVGRFSQSLLVADFAKSYAEGALERLANMFIATGSTIVENDVPTFSVVAHESLNFIEERATWLLQCAYTQVSQGFEAVSDKSSFGEGMMLLAFNIANIAKIQLDSVTRRIFAIMSSTSSLWHFNPLRVNLSISPRTVPLDYDLAYWGAKDRALAIIFGYLFFALVGVIYLNVNAWFRGINRAAGKVGGGVADVLHQAGGVLKVILIISIEMIAFPLYCGLLLDVALLPLFSNATLMSRIEFTLTSPYTSIFVHWFVGTCYMFHFALFVAMCRKLMRTGVLCKLVSAS